MTEMKFDTGRNHFAYIDRNAKHTILITQHATTSHYVSELSDLTTVTIKNELTHITHSALGTMLHFRAEDGEQVTLVLSSVAPEQLCDAVEAARLQRIDG
jgi:hypothetical protein